MHVVMVTLDFVGDMSVHPALRETLIKNVWPAVAELLEKHSMWCISRLHRALNMQCQTTINAWMRKRTITFESMLSLAIVSRAHSDEDLENSQKLSASTCSHHTMDRALKLFPTDACRILVTIHNTMHGQCYAEPCTIFLARENMVFMSFPTMDPFPHWTTLNTTEPTQLVEVQYSSESVHSLLCNQIKNIGIECKAIHSLLKQGE